jgi:putative hydrolase of the HAD superfamily
MSEHKYKAVLLDLDDTLLKSSLIYDRALRFTSDYLADKYRLDRENFFKSVMEKHLIVHRNFPTVHTRHSRILVYRMALEDTPMDYDLTLLPKVEDMYWEYFLDNVEVYEGVPETLAKIKENDMDIGIVSDGDLSLRIRKIKASGLIDYIDQLVASEEVIFEKPFSAIFTLALSRLSVEPHNAVMLGNDYKSDVRGAQMVGVRAGIFDPDKDAAVLNDDGSVDADFKINNFPELLEEIGIAS